MSLSVISRSEEAKPLSPQEEHGEDEEEEQEESESGGGWGFGGFFSAIAKKVTKKVTDVGRSVQTMMGSTGLFCLFFLYLLLLRVCVCMCGMSVLLMREK